MLLASMDTKTGLDLLQRSVRYEVWKRLKKSTDWTVLLLSVALYSAICSVFLATARTTLSTSTFLFT